MVIELDFAMSRARCQEVAEVLVDLIGHHDPNVRIGSLDMIREHGPLLCRDLPRRHLARLRQAVERACQDQAANDYAHDDQLAELDVIRVCEVAKVALGSLEAGQRSPCARHGNPTTAEATKATKLSETTGPWQ